jgi:hypothetical protein
MEVYSVYLQRVVGKRHFHPGEMMRGYPLDERLGDLQSLYARRGEQKILDRTGTRTPIPRSSNQ